MHGWSFYWPVIVLEESVEQPDAGEKVIRYRGSGARRDEPATDAICVYAE